LGWKENNQQSIILYNYNNQSSERSQDISASWWRVFECRFEAFERDTKINSHTNDRSRIVIP